MNTETPRTDGLLTQHFLGRKYVLADEVVKLERELGEANTKLSKLSRMIDIAGQANDAASEAEVANSATFAEAMAHTNTEMVEAERDQLRAEVARQKARSVPIDPSISDKFEIKDHSVFVIRNGTAYLAGIRELADMTELVDARNELAKLRAEVERVKIELDLERRHLEHERQTVEFLRSGEEVLKSQVKELINQRNQLLPLQSEMTNLKETHIMQLAAISVAANSNTDSTIEEALKCHPDYKTVALRDVVNAVKREIRERNEKDQWRAVADMLWLALANDGVFTNNSLSDQARSSAISEYKKQKEGK